MKIIIAPDSFKGSLSAIEVGQTIKNAFTHEFKEADIQVVPMADGGEGTVAALLFATNGQCMELEAAGPTGQSIPAFYGILGDRKTVVIEVAGVIGHTLVPEQERNPLEYTTHGVGELIVHALDNGFRHFIIGLGGSATNDGGIGMLHALGAKFYDQDHNTVTPIAASLSQVRSVDYKTIDPRIWESDVRAACDVDNPLCGPNGASFIFGPQKGATVQQIEQLDWGLSVYADAIEQHLQHCHQFTAGAGAAGGLGFAFLTIGAELESGASLVGRSTNIEERLSNADWLITGEGRTDEQSLRGKLPVYLAKTAKEYGVSTILLSGGVDDKLESLFDYFDSMHAIANGPLSLEASVEKAESLLFHKARNIARLLKRNHSR